MNASKVQPKTTAGVDLGDRYSYLCLIDQHSGEIMEEGRLPTSPEAFTDGALPRSSLLYA
jgi:hypothetical protein